MRSSAHPVIAAQLVAAVPGGSALLLAVVLVSACGNATPSGAPSTQSVSPQVMSSPAASAPEPTVVLLALPTPGPAEVSFEQDGFRLVLTLPSTTVAASEPVSGEAVLTNADGGAAGIAGSGGGVFGFSYREIGGTRSMDSAHTDDCAPYTIPAGDGLRSSLRPSGGWSEGDPNAPFYRAFVDGPDVRLPAGAWEVTAHAVFMGPGCSLPQRTLDASTVVVVTP